MAYNKLFGEEFPRAHAPSYNTPYSKTQQPLNDFDVVSEYNSDFRALPMKDMSTSSVKSRYEEADPIMERTPYSQSVLGLKGQRPDIASSYAGAPWTPGYKAQFPWAGALALIIAMGATIACIVVLCVSDQVSIEAWRGTFQPTVYLSISTAIANIALTFALYKGAVIYFWRKLLRGTSLQDIHQYWDAAHSFQGAIIALVHFRGQILSLACIFTILSILRGPLLQRASAVKNISSPTAGSLTFRSAQQLPDGFAGSATGRTTGPAYMNPNFTFIVKDYSLGLPINASFSGCDSTCYTSVKGFGFGVSCNTSYIPYQLMPEMFSNGSMATPPTTEVFSADASTTPISGPDDDSFQETAALLLNTTLMANVTQSSNGSLMQHLCTLRGGIVSYPVVISNRTVYLRSSSWTNDTFLEEQPLFWPASYGQPSNLAGFILAIQGLFKGTATLYFGGAVGYEMDLIGSSANRYLMAQSAQGGYWDIGNNMTWADPMPDMISAARELAFRTSLQLAIYNASYANATQHLDYTGQQERTVYTTSWPYTIGGLVASFAGILSVIPVFWGFWELGRPVSMSPLEIAKAFDAPVLSKIAGNRPAEDMAKDLGKLEVRYGDAGPTGDPAVRKIEVGLTRDTGFAQPGVRYR